MASFNTENAQNPEEYNFQILDPSLPEIKKEMQEIIDAYLDLKAPPVETLTPEQARQNPELRDAFLAVLHNHVIARSVKGVVIPIKEISHTLIPTPAGELTARIYNPDPTKEHPIFLYFHGGGFVLANLNTYDSSCRAIAQAAECIVISVAYRQAPEHVFPAAHDDAYWAYKWVVENASEIGGSGKVAVGGESAGGNLAASICLRAKEEGFKLPLHQVLIYPLLDNNLERNSYLVNENAKPLNKAMMQWFFSHYFKSQTSEEWAFPLKAKVLEGLPSACVITAEIDPLRSEGDTFAEQLVQSKVKVFHKCYTGVTHEFFGFVALVPEAQEALNEVARELQAAFNQN